MKKAEEVEAADKYNGYSVLSGHTKWIPGNE